MPLLIALDTPLTDRGTVSKSPGNKVEQRVWDQFFPKAQLPGGERVAEYSVCKEVTKTACDVFRF